MRDVAATLEGAKGMQEQAMRCKGRVGRRGRQGILVHRRRRAPHDVYWHPSMSTTWTSEARTMYAIVPRCRRRWRVKYAAQRGAACVRIPAQSQCTQTQSAGTRSACVHRAILHIASSASSATASRRLWFGAQGSSAQGAAGGSTCANA